MRVLLLSQFYPPVAGGVEVHVATLAEGLAKRGHTVAVGTLSSEAESTGGVEVHRLPTTTGRIGALHSTDRRHAPPFPDPELAWAIRRLVRTFGPHVVHAHNWIGRSYVPLAASSSARYLVTLHDCGTACAQLRRMYKGEEFCEEGPSTACGECCTAFYGRAKGAVTLGGTRLMKALEARAVDLYLPVSRAVAEASGIQNSAHVVVPNFVALREQRARPNGQLAALPLEPFILQVGDAVPDKGVHVLFEAYRRLKSPPPLVLIGRIADGVRSALPNGALALGVLPHELVAEAWRRSLFGTMPSLCLDACPTVTMEAMAAGKPAVASDRGGLSDLVVDGETGYLVPPGEPQPLADAMQRLIDDPALCERMGQRAEARFRAEYEAEAVIDHIEGLYVSLVS